MNVAQANALSLPEILEKLGHKPTRTKGVDLWYLSPLRGEKTPSFHVNTRNNVWFDFGAGDGGGVVDFILAFIRSHGTGTTVRDALQFLNHLKSGISVIPETQAIPQDMPARTEPALTLRSVLPIKNMWLRAFLGKRGIPLAVAQKHIRQVLVHNANTKKGFYALGLANEEGGYEIRNAFFKGSVGAKAISVIRGKDQPARDVHIFEGMMDFLTACAYSRDRQLAGDAIVLNSTALLPQAFPYLKASGYQRLFTWLDNDSAGHAAIERLTAFAEDETGISVNSANAIYAGHKDVNDWHVSRLEKGRLYTADKYRERPAIEN